MSIPPPKGWGSGSREGERVWGGQGWERSALGLLNPVILPFDPRTGEGRAGTEKA